MMMMTMFDITVHSGFGTIEKGRDHGLKDGRVKRLADGDGNGHCVVGVHIEIETEMLVVRHDDGMSE